MTAAIKLLERGLETRGALLGSNDAESQKLAERARKLRAEADKIVCEMAELTAAVRLLRAHTMRGTNETDLDDGRSRAAAAPSF